MSSNQDAIADGVVVVEDDTNLGPLYPQHFRSVTSIISSLRTWKR